MKALIIILLLSGSLSTFAQTATETGTSPMGPATMGQPTYSNDGERTRTDDVTGSGMSDATHMSSDVNPSVPTRTPKMKQKQEKETQTGPYKNGKYQYWDPDKENSDR